MKKLVIVGLMALSLGSFAAVEKRPISAFSKLTNICAEIEDIVGPFDACRNINQGDVLNSISHVIVAFNRSYNDNYDKLDSNGKKELRNVYTEITSLYWKTERKNLYPAIEKTPIGIFSKLTEICSAIEDLVGPFEACKNIDQEDGIDTVFDVLSAFNGSYYKNYNKLDTHGKKELRNISTDISDLYSKTTGCKRFVNDKNLSSCE